MNKRSCGLPGIQWRVPFVSIAALVSVFVLAENATAQTPRDAEDYDDGFNEAKASPLDSGTVKPQFVETFPVILAVNLDLITHFVKTAAKAGANSFLQNWANHFAAPAIC